MAPTDLIESLETRVDAWLSPKRAAHSRGVADFSARLCERNGIDPQRGRIAGLAHDLCKELPMEEQRRLFLAYVQSHSDDAFPWCDEASGGVIAEDILHGPAAAAVLFDEYGLMDGDIIEAVAYHTVGKPGMCLLSILVYCADKIEPGRKHVDEAFRLRCLSLEPEAMLLAVVEDTLAWLARKGAAVAPPTVILYNSLRKSVKAS